MRELDLGKTNINRIFWMYVIPSIFSIIFSTTAQLIDSAFIGRYVGSNGLAAITMLFPFFMILNGVSIMIAIGGVTYAGIQRGKNELEKSNNFFNLSIVMVVIAGVSASLIFIILNNFFGILFDVNNETLSMIQTYGFWISIFFVFNMVNLTFNLFLNLDKKPVLVVIISGFGTVINMVLNYAFIVLLDMGIMGAALASGVSQIIPGIIFIYIIIKRSSWRFRFPILKFNDVKQILFNGSSELVSISSVAISGFILNKVILDSVGIIGVAGFSIALQLGGLVISFGFGVSDAIQSPISFNYGAVQYNRVKAILLKGIRINVFFGLVLSILSLFFGDLFAKIFVTDQETIIYASQILKFYSLAFIFMGSNVIISTYYTSVDSPVISGVISLLKSMVFIVIWLIILPPLLGNNGIWLALVFAEVSTSITALFIYIKFPYGKKQTEKIYWKRCTYE